MPKKEEKSATPVPSEQPSAELTATQYIILAEYVLLPFCVHVHPVTLKTHNFRSRFEL